MKKFIYITLFVIISGLASACTEENITPSSDNSGTGQGGGF